MKMKMKVDAIKERYRQHLLAVCEEAEAKLRAGQTKDANEIAALHGAAEKQNSAVQYLQSSLERLVGALKALQSVPSLQFTLAKFNIVCHRHLFVDIKFMLVQSTRAEDLESQLHDSNECLREEHVRNEQLQARVMELEK